MRGEVLRYDDSQGEGLISGDDGIRYNFSRSDLQQLAPLSAGQRVDFDPVAGRATQIFLIGAAPTTEAAAATGATTNPQRGLWGHFAYCMKMYVNGNGRASRAEYWSFILFEIIFFIIAVIIDLIITVAVYGSNNNGSQFLPIFIGLTGLALFLPSVTLLIRRFHDLGMTGWFVLLSIVPYVGGLFTFVISLIPGQAAPNKHGPGPGQSFA